MTARMHLLVWAAMLACIRPLLANEKSGDAQEPSATLALLIERDLWALVRLDVTIDDVPIDRVWKDTFAELFTFCDHDRNGMLDEQEASRLPSPAAIRQLLWNRLSAQGGSPPAWAQLDQNGDGRLVSQEVTAFYRRAGLGRPIVGLGRPPLGESLTATLVKHLDLDADGRLGDREWQQAEELLPKLDRDDDEMLSASELLPGSLYPGCGANLLLLSPSKAGLHSEKLDNVPLVLLPSDPEDSYWTEWLVARRDRDRDGHLGTGETGLTAETFAKLDTDRDNRLGVAELRGLRDQAPKWHSSVRWTGDSHRIDAAKPGPHARRLELAGLQFEVQTTDADLLAQLSATRASLLAQFARADENQDFVLDAQELAKPSQTRMQGLLVAADRDGDGRLGQEELVSRLELERQIAQGMVLITLLDFGAGLFEFVDRDHDGALSRRELREARARCHAYGLIEKDEFKGARPPHQLVATISRGQPRSLLQATPEHTLPGWFTAMDANRDSDLSPREFLGAPPRFAELDRNTDGLLSADEAAGP